MTRRMLILVLIWLVTLIYSTRTTYADDMWTKAGRGAANLFTGFYEIPHNVIEMSETERWPIAAFGGLFKGLFRGVTRTVVGAVELVTFPLPIPNGYSPMMYPEFIVEESYRDTPEWGEDDISQVR